MSSSSITSTKLFYGLVVGLGVTALTSITLWLHKKWNRDVMPQRWRRVGTLANINLFPIKSCAPLKLDSDAVSVCELLGLRIEGFRDRCLMIIDKDNRETTARTYPKMVLIQPTMVNSTKMIVTAPGMSTTLELDFATLVNEAPTKKVRTAVWGTDIDVLLCGEKYDTWFSQAIMGKEFGLRLVYYPYLTPVRSVTASLKKQAHITRQDTGTLNDATSYMLMNLSSLADLNTRLNTPVNPIQFRGNFHIKMDFDEPYAEDNWCWIKIGEQSMFRNVAPCTRCIFPNINALTGERDLDGQPLKTLKKYRKWPQYASPVLGIHMGLRQTGNVKINDIVYVEDVQ